MNDRKKFAAELSQLNLTRVGQAIAFLWYYRVTQAYEERTASDLANDLAEEGFGRPNVTELNKSLRKSKQTVKGKRAKTFQIHIKHFRELSERYGSLIDLKEVKVTPSVIPNTLVEGTRLYLERIVHQINGAYDYGFYDASAVLVRRLSELLIIEVFVHKQIVDEIKENGTFLPLDKLIGKVKNHSQINLGRNTPRTLESIKTLGDTAAHDRYYITQRSDIDDLKLEIRKALNELIILSGIQAKK